MEDELPEVKDDSRAFFQRKEGRMGLYLEIYDAKAEHPKEYGSDHFFLMSLKEKLAEYLDDFDLVKAKGIMESKNVGKGVILEKFEHGLVLSLAFDNTEAVEGIWKLQCTNKLTPIVQDMFVDEVMLKTVGAVRVTLQAKLYEDEYTVCKTELLSTAMDRLSLKKSQNGISMVKRLREAQKQIVEMTCNLRDEETQFEQNLSTFILNVKQILPTNILAINTLKEFHTNIKIAKGTKGVKAETFETIDHYFRTLQQLRKALAQVERIVWYPLSQIHAACENESQKTTKKSIKDTLTETVNMLKVDSDLQRVNYKEWEGKILFREQKLFLGLVSLVPLALEKILDIDHMVDEYITDFPDRIKV
ncbi:hypothetical protein SNE40_021559 [Patella caerulea]|uniref:Uncharacterized protein n=1 Tax=Patella caerulea TaxID=87958 RepID=A0AAN8FZS1_PATCE